MIRRTDWTGAQAPSLDDLESLAEVALRGLPEEFLRLVGDIQIRVADFPEADVVDEMGLQTDFDILGLFQGVGLAHDSAVAHTGQLPNMIWLYRRPILDYWAEHDDTLAAIVSHVLIHEIGHHFGLSDEDMEAIEAAAET